MKIGGKYNTKFTPTGKCLPEIGMFELSGESYVDSYQVLDNALSGFLRTLNTYLKTPQQVVLLDVKLSYFNSATTKWLDALFAKLDTYQLKQRGNVTVRWYYQTGDLDLCETGEDFKALTKYINFELVSFD